MNHHQILVVDDHQIWLDTVAMILGDEYDLTTTTDPDEALVQVRSSTFSLVILDQRLGSMTGVELLTMMRQQDRNLRAIILTGFAEVHDAVESMRGGALDYISKGEKNLREALRHRVARALSPDSTQNDITLQIQRGESAELEFKSSARWDLRQNKMNREMEHVIVKTVVAFLNSEGGGSLLIGVDDAGNVVGLRHDYLTLKKQDRDGFETFLVNLLLEACGKDIAPLLRIDFGEFAGQDVCRVSARSSRRPVFVREGNTSEQLYVRTGNATRQLSTREAVEYCKLRWG